jgi:hypothetical protein
MVRTRRRILDRCRSGEQRRLVQRSQLGSHWRDEHFLCTPQFPVSVIRRQLKRDRIPPDLMLAVRLALIPPAGRRRDPPHPAKSNAVSVLLDERAFGSPL